MSELTAGIPIDLNMPKVPVYRILGRNPGMMTGPGTNSYLLGSEQLCLVDPGPQDAEQLQSFLDAIGQRPLVYILLTHTHRDHSPGAMPLAAATGAGIVGLPAPQSPGQDFSPEFKNRWQQGDVLDLGEYQIELIHTPGHVSNHLCYLLKQEKLLFTGDHILQGTTPVILPPDGSMSDYLSALRKLQPLDLKYLAPGHGGLMDNPALEIDRLIKHRLRREEKIAARLHQMQPCSIDELVLSAYDDVGQQLIPIAKKTLLAHLLKLERDGRAEQIDGQWQSND